MTTKITLLATILWLFAACHSPKPSPKPIDLNNRAASMMFSNPDSALLLLNLAIETDKFFYPACANKIQLFCTLGKYDSAIEANKKAIELKPELPEAYTFLGMLYDKTGQHELASDQYRHAIGLFDKNILKKDSTLTENRMNRACALLLSGNEQEGKKEVGELLLVDSGNAALQSLQMFDKDQYLDLFFKKPIGK